LAPYFSQSISKYSKASKKERVPYIRITFKRLNRSKNHKTRTGLKRPKKREIRLNQNKIVIIEWKAESIGLFAPKRISYAYFGFNEELYLMKNKKRSLLSSFF
jgi:hypothetical protein